MPIQRRIISNSVVSKVKSELSVLQKTKEQVDKESFYGQAKNGQN